MKTLFYLLDSRSHVLLWCSGWCAGLGAALPASSWTIAFCALFVFMLWGARRAHEEGRN